MNQREVQVMIERNWVACSNITSIGYDARTMTVEVEVHGVAVYQYYNVPPGLYDQMMQATPKGSLLKTYIKNAYPYSRTG